MDERRDEERPETEAGAKAAADERKRSDDISIGVVFGVLGFTLFLTLDTPWAGLPMLVVGIVFVARGMRGRTRRRTDG
ncbi:hypothetical protein ES689_12485 [Frigoribacterium sp. ACAM 257]|uniref:hypothetical protein n=1 Tax=Frigoribacterium sp. ACAM 257 TaxID=2508998 RepID=UPI0011BA04BC|nr:hypothetical protein [Frigoribacterium sp. ACAM 257]TWX36217.1 hypothetical protein ES689_12485 [Frigoribacterium sp. ACAM 257]